MADYSTASANAEAALNDTTSGGMVEEYQIGNRRVKRGKAADQVAAALLLEGIAARRGSGVFRVVKPKAPR